MKEWSVKEWCVKELSVKEWCAKEFHVKDLCVTKLCVKVLRVKCDGQGIGKTTEMLRARVCKYEKVHCRMSDKPRL